jgi:predicted nucleic acid-binding protein
MATRKKCLVDTSVLIALLRKKDEAKFMLERDYTLNFLDAYGLLRNNELVSDKSIQLMKRYCIQRAGQPMLRLADCLIAAFAAFHKMELLTFNKKDFDFIKGFSIHRLSK